jgi:Calcineurin-like phosphoesterase
MAANTKQTHQGAHRFAHPFFTKVPAAQRGRMLDHIKGTLHPIPDRDRDAPLNLAEIIGANSVQEIQNAGKIIIHVAGDTGLPENEHETRQVMVADAMTKDYKIDDPANCPAFFLHLGDVIYGPNPDSFRDQFYRAYMHYPGKIIAIPGNHDGESDAKMNAFRVNFCAGAAKVPPIAGSIFRETMTQPGVYWLLDAPFVQIIGLYTNSAENPGFISGEIPGPKQKDWLIKTLSDIAAARPRNGRKALFFATHHPPYSSGGHSGSHEMLADLDDACKKANVMPDAIFSGHAHSIQRYTRSVPFNGTQLKIPYIVSGCGGHGDQAVRDAGAAKADNPVYNFSYRGWGYTRLEVTPKTFTITSFKVDWDANMDAVASRIDGPTEFQIS